MTLSWLDKQKFPCKILPLCEVRVGSLPAWLLLLRNSCCLGPALVQVWCTSVYKSHYCQNRHMVCTTVLSSAELAASQADCSNNWRYFKINFLSRGKGRIPLWAQNASPYELLTQGTCTYKRDKCTKSLSDILESAQARSFNVLASLGGIHFPCSSFFPRFLTSK